MDDCLARGTHFERENYCIGLEELAEEISLALSDYFSANIDVKDGFIGLDFPGDNRFLITISKR